MRGFSPQEPGKHCHQFLVEAHVAQLPAKVGFIILMMRLNRHFVNLKKTSVPCEYMDYGGKMYLQNWYQNASYKNIFT